MRDGDKPVKRKVQLTGGSTYTVSLPKEWAGEQGIEPGCHVNLYSQADQLVMTRNGGPNGTQHATTIDAIDEEPAMLSLAVASAYVAGCEEVRVENLRERDQRRAVTRSVRRFVGLEVMTEDDRSLTARTMLDVGDLSPEQTLAQLERTTMEMHEHAVEAVVEADGTAGAEVVRQDDDVDRLFALVSRGFQQSLVDPAATMGDDPLTPFEYYMAARQLERVADHAEKVATIADRLDSVPPDDIVTQLVGLSEESRSVIRRALSGLLDGPDTDTPALGTVIADAETLLEDVAALDEQVYDRAVEDGYLLGLVVDSISRSTQYGLNVAESGLQVRHRTA